MTANIDFTKYIRNVLNKEPEDWSLSKNFFHSFYKKNILKDNSGWIPEKVKVILDAVKNIKKADNKNFTDSLLDKFLSDHEATNIINKMMEIVKICDVHAYKQDNSMPVVANTFIRQNAYYEMILKWKLEKRRESLKSDLFESDILSPNMKNAFLCLCEPRDFIFMVSPKHRAQFISTFIDKTAKNASVYKSKEGLLESNRIILDFFRSQLKSDPELLSQLESAKLNEHFLTRVVSIAVYQPEVRPIWDINVKPTNEKEQYWTYAPGEDASEWEELYKDGLMAIGWGFLGDLKQYRSKDQIRKKMEDHYNKKGLHTNRTLACYEFLKKIKIGDVIFAKKGQKKVIGYGIVESDYFFDTNRKKYQHVRKIHWETKGEWDVGDDKIALKTLTNITKYKNFVERLKVLVNFDKKESANYWWLIANPQIWKFYDYDVGQRQIYTNRNEKGNKSRIFEHFIKKLNQMILFFAIVQRPIKNSWVNLKLLEPSIKQKKAKVLSLR
jgi:hypothetical protein